MLHSTKGSNLTFLTSEKKTQKKRPLQLGIPARNLSKLQHTHYIKKEITEMYLNGPESLPYIK